MIASAARSAFLALIGTPGVNAALRLLAHARGHRLILVYHRVQSGAPGSGVVPEVSSTLLRSQLEALGEVVDLVSLEVLLQGPNQAATNSRGRKPMVAVTFDDDLTSHATDALPVLRALGVPATFFLSGRALHGRGAYWFQQLDTLVTHYGTSRVAERLGRLGLTVDDLVALCQDDHRLQQQISRLAGDFSPSPVLGADQIAALVRGGMEIGFHTVDHDVLPAIEDDRALADAVTFGREQLAEAAGVPVRFFAYPYGKANKRCAAAVREAGFAAGLTGSPSPIRPGQDQYGLGRWEPGARGVDDLLVKLAIRLHRAAPDDSNHHRAPGRAAVHPRH